MERTGSEDGGELTKVGEESVGAIVDLHEHGTEDVVSGLSLDSGSKSAVVVTARGTADGLVIRLDGRVECDALRGALNDFLSDRKTFVTKQSVVLEWIGASPDDSTVASITEDLRVNYSIKVKSSEVRMVALAKPTNSKSNAAPNNTAKTGLTSESSKVGLFGGIAGFDLDENRPSVAPSRASERQASSGHDDISDSGSQERDTRVRSINSRTASSSASAATKGYDPTLWDDADTRLVCKTLRSGQKIETEHSLLVIGDVNSGAELVAGGDIIVLGALRGVAHAGAFDETGGGRFIFALELEPTQLRIGAIISRGAQAEATNKKTVSDGSEIARVDGNIIVVEPYSARAVTTIRR